MMRSLLKCLIQNNRSLICITLSQEIMKNKLTLIFGILLVTLSSCVYSLFPIYTEDTLVFKKELLGKWATTEDGSEYMLFQNANAKEADEEEKGAAYTLKIREGFTMSSDEPISMVINGDTIYDEGVIREEMLKKLSKVENPEKSNEDAFDKVQDKVESVLKDKKWEFKGTVSVSDTEKSYKLKIVTSDAEQDYTAHLVEIGGDLFMDIYPETHFSSNNFSENYFPVHTFFKVDLSENKFKLTSFDLEKLNKLFESNLIRLRHENVEGSILITAQPEELQKFIDKYSDDESVFEEAETYHRVKP